MLTQRQARSHIRLVPGRGAATVTLNPDFMAVPQAGTISASGSTITGVGTAFKSGPVPILIGSVLVANSTSGNQNYISGGTNVVTNGTLLNVTAVSSDTIITVSQTGLSFSDASFFANNSTIVQCYNAWEKPISSRLADYGRLKLQGDETLINVPDSELNPIQNGREIRAEDWIQWNGVTYIVTDAGTTEKTLHTDWQCVCRKLMS
jgi:hypothetical protein